MKKAFALVLTLFLALPLAACLGETPLQGGESSSAPAAVPQSAFQPPAAPPAASPQSTSGAAASASASAPAVVPPAFAQAPPGSGVQSGGAPGTGSAQTSPGVPGLPNVPGVTAEVPPYEEQVRLLEETNTERSYLITSDIIIPGSDNPSAEGGFAYTITVPAPLYIEGGHIEIPGHFKTLYSDDQPSLKLTDHGSTLFFPDKDALEAFVFPGEAPGEDTGLGGASQSEAIEHGTIELDGGRTLCYNYYHSTSESSVYIYNAAVDLGGGLAPYFSFFVFDGLTPEEWREPAVFEAILASVRPYGGGE